MAPQNIRSKTKNDSRGRGKGRRKSAAKSTAKSTGRGTETAASIASNHTSSEEVEENEESDESLNISAFKRAPVKASQLLEEHPDLLTNSVGVSFPEDADPNDVYMDYVGQVQAEQIKRKRKVEDEALEDKKNIKNRKCSSIF
jgi:hypothetical protein